jgi:hypothetical protein
MSAGLIAGFVAFTILAGMADRITNLPIPLSNAPRIFPKTESGQLDLRNGDAYQVFSLPAYHLPIRDILPKVLLDLAAHDLFEPAGILFDLKYHDAPLLLHPLST